MTARFLLDTHVLLWALTAPERLSATAHTIIRSRSSDLSVSAASAWEISTKRRIGKLPQADALVGAYGKHVDRLGATRLAITDDHALLAGDLEWEHRDPFDRMIASQAMIESMSLITADRAFAELRGISLVW
ncbi:type II toxin-antitoxin system VapC family toxin [Paramicrobacterium agarici]|uniref:type II toxin-antitoxin system VapC family toxin n=1 Tax=Paramicrobacterium agarici TaxID=630514 RepID=UPI00114EABB4|nr:type II toxin-antitoxin system VapC family toxin [Microbacterium agarici]TQO21940.1 PIN domain nuclease of toxin-antitoxin system [Microbacterium agarici]